MEPHFTDTYSGPYRPDIPPATSASGLTPRTTTFTLPRPGLWEVTVRARYGNSNNHITMTQWWLTFYDDIADISNAQVKMTTVVSSGSLILPGDTTLSAPTSAGVVTVTSPWADGNSYTVDWRYVARLIMPLP